MTDDARMSIAKAIASKTYAFGGRTEEFSDQYDCGEWEEMGPLAHATYLDAADAVLTYAREYAVRLVEAAYEDAAKVADHAVTYVVGEQRDLCDRIAAAIRTKGAQAHG